jgi:hypothetical protein
MVRKNSEKLKKLNDLLIACGNDHSKILLDAAEELDKLNHIIKDISAILYPIELDPAQRAWYYDGDGQKVYKETRLIFKEPFSS